MERQSKLRAFVDMLRGPRHVYREGVYTFPKLDIPRVKKEMRLAQLGEERGRSNQPSSDGDEPDEIEHRITNFIQAKRDEAHEEANAAFMILAERLAATSVEGRATDIKVEVESRVANFIAAVAGGENRLHLARREVLAAERGLAAFRAKHNIDRPAEYPDSHWLAFGIIASIVAAESAMNGIFLGDAQPFGILGGVVIALMISLVNITIGVAAGRWGWSGVKHRSRVVKTAAVILILVCVAALVVVNLAAAHYRATLLAGNYRTPEIEALARMTAAPLGVGDMKSWLLFVIGLVSAIVAGLKGFTWDDPYPGYGRRDRHYRHTARAYEEAARDVMDELDGIKDDAVAEAQALKREIEKRREERGRIVGHRMRLAANFGEHMRHLEGALRELTGAYREANTKARTAPPPARFRTAPPFESASIVVSEDLDARKAETAYSRINETLETMIGKLLAEHAEALHRFKSIETLTYEEVARAAERQAVAAA